MIYTAHTDLHQLKVGLSLDFFGLIDSQMLWRWEKETLDFLTWTTCHWCNEAAWLDLAVIGAVSRARSAALGDTER